MTGQVAVIGAGVAGTAAAWRLAKHGVRATVFGAWRGASALYSGIVDGTGELDADAQAFVAELGLWTLDGQKSLRVVTSSAVLRQCRGADARLLDCEALAGARIAIADLPRYDWNGRLIGRALDATDWARRSGTSFVVTPLDPFQDPSERLFSAYDFGRQFDEEARADALCDAALRAGNFDAWLFGPWLGLETASIERIRARLRTPVGETTSLPGGLAGARLERSCTRLLRQYGVELEQAVVHEVAPTPDGIVIDFEPERGQRRRCEVRSAIIACGGVAGGGIRLVHSAGDRAPRRPFRLSFLGDMPLLLDGRLLDDVASLHGFDLTSSGLAPLERVGLATDGARVRGESGIFAAGDVVAARPRTMLEAVRGGCGAARQLLGSMSR